MKCDRCDFKPEAMGLEHLAFTVCPECECILCEECIKNDQICYCEMDREMELCYEYDPCDDEGARLL